MTTKSRIRFSVKHFVLRLCAVACGAVLAACSFNDEVVQVSFTAAFGERVVVDGGAEGNSQGDYIPGSGDLLDNDGGVIGEFNVVTFVTGVNDSGQGRVMMSEYSFGKGEDSLVIAGAGHSPAGDEPLPDRSYTYPVVGGTGQYAGARGECIVTRVGPSYDVDCLFEVLAS